jgi:hypothetical protein
MRLLAEDGANKPELLRLFLISAGGETRDGNKQYLQQQELHAARKEISNLLKKMGASEPIETAIIRNLHNATLFKPDVEKTTGYVLRAQALCTTFPVPEYLIDLCIQFCLHNKRLPAEVGYMVATRLAISRKEKRLRKDELQTFLERLVQETSANIFLAADIQKILSER